MVSHLVKVVDLFILMHLDCFALSGDLLVQWFYFRDKLLHLFKIGSVLCVECHLQLASTGLVGVWLVVDYHSVALFFEFIKGWAISHPKETNHSLIVSELGNRHHVVQEVRQDTHSLLYMSLSALRGFLFRNRRNYLHWVQLSQVFSKPYKIAVTPAYHPLHLESLNCKLQERRSANAKETS